VQAVSRHWNGPRRSVDYRQDRIVALVLSSVRKWMADHPPRNIGTEAPTSEGHAPRDTTEAIVTRVTPRFAPRTAWAAAEHSTIKLSD
jgi:hypothetical protein